MSLDDGGYTVNISIMAKPEHSICLFYLKSERSKKHNVYAYDMYLNVDLLETDLDLMLSESTIIRIFTKA